jgi:hypothetical protein
MLRTGCLLAPQRDFVVTLRRSGLPYRRPPATALLGHYAGRTLTGKFITAFRTHTTTASDAHPASHLLPEVIGYKAPRSTDTLAGQRAGEGLTSSRRHYPNVPCPVRRGVLQRLHIQVFSAFHGLRPDFGGSALLHPTHNGQDH